jgi:transcriptional regulator with XRE-family HTH domain
VKTAVNAADKRVGKRIRMRRLMLGMSQSQLASAIGVTFQQVQKYEAGINRVSASRLQQMAKVLKVEVAFFFQGLPAPRGTASQKTANMTATVDDLLSTANGLLLVKAFMNVKSRRLRALIVDLITAVANASD